MPPRFAELIVIAVGGVNNHGLTLPHNSRRNSNDGRMRRNIVHDDGIRSNPRAIADHDRANDFRARTNENVVADHRTLTTFGSDRHLVFNFDVGAAPDGSINYDAERMNQHETWSKFGAPTNDAPATNRVNPVEQ